MGLAGHNVKLCVEPKGQAINHTPFNLKGMRQEERKEMTFGNEAL